MRRATLTLLPLCCLVVAAAHAEEAATVAWKVKPGHTASYRFETRNVGGDVAWTFSATSKSKILEIATDGKIKVEESLSNAKLTVGGQELAGVVDGLNVSTRATYLPNGAREGTPEGQDPRVTVALQFIYPEKPVKVGDTWKRTVKADAARGLRAGEATYRYEGTESVGKWKAHKVSVTYKETEGIDPISLRGTEWLSVEDGAAVQTRYTVQNGPFTPGSPPEPEAEITANRID
jgi:hypothetical protein